MSKTNKFYFFVSIILLLYICSFVYIINKKQDEKSKLEFIKLTGLTSFALNSNTFYLRHQNNSGMNDIFYMHPGFKEKDTQTFLNSGFQKRFLNK